MIVKTKMGNQSDVVYAEFGSGDISFSKAREIDENHESILFFQNQNPPREIGSTSSEKAGLTTDELEERIQFALKFRRKESILAVIHSLQEIYDQFPDGEYKSVLTEEKAVQI